VLYKHLLSKSTLRWRYKQVLSEGIPTLKIQTVAFQINSLHWRYKQLLSKAFPMLEVQTLTVYKELLSKSTPTLEVQTVGALIIVL